MIYVTKPQDTKCLDKKAVEECFIPSILLMEHAAYCVFNIIKPMIDKTTKILIVCGGGNNAGDGFALARLLKTKNYMITVIMLDDPDRYKNDCLTNYNIAKAIDMDMDGSIAIIDEYDMIIDAVFGTGLDRDLKGIYLDAIRKINQSSAKVVSIDMPSGINALNGMIMGDAVKADISVSFTSYKRGQLLYPGREYCGRIYVEDIGIPLVLLAGFQEFVLTQDYIKSILKKRSANSHKGTYGHALIIAGSSNYLGAALLCISACIKSGVGLTTWLTPIRPAIDEKNFLFETMIRLADNIDGELHMDDELLLNEIALDKTAIAVGPGLGIDGASSIMKHIVNLKIPLVIDADALNILAVMKDQIDFRGRAILTPHPKEASRLLNCDVNEVINDPIASAKKIAKKYNCVCVLKSSTTIIADIGGCVAYNINGNAGMAKGGSGDVLTGIICALIAQGYSAFDSAGIGAFIHGLSGDFAAKDSSLESMIPSDIIDNLYKAFRQLNQ